MRYVFMRDHFDEPTDLVMPSTVYMKFIDEMSNQAYYSYWQTFLGMKIKVVRDGEPMKLSRVNKYGFKLEMVVPVL